MANTFHPPAICSNGHISQGAMGLGPGGSGTVVQYNVTDCPQCPEIARIFDGIYDTALNDEGRLKVHITALDIDQLKRLRDMLHADITLEEVKELAEVEQDQKIKKILKFSAKYGYRLYRTQQNVEQLLETLIDLGVLNG